MITVVGNEVIEAATPWRSRNFEITAYRDLLMEYFQRARNTHPLALAVDHPSCL